MVDDTQKRRRQLVGMFAIALATLGGSYALFYVAREGGVWGTTNNGSFVVPPQTVAELALQDAFGRPLTEGQTWWLWIVAPDDCAAACEQAVHQLRQLHVLLHKDAERVRRGLLTRTGWAPRVLDDYPQLMHLTGALDTLDEGIYIVDPIGNLVLYYPLTDAGKPVLEDLKRLLKLSQIG